MRSDGYVVANLAANYDLGHGVTAFARIDNRHYEDPIGFLRPGLSAFAGIKVAFDAGSKS